MYPWYGKKNDIPARNVEGIHFGRFKQWKMKKSIV